MKASLSRMVVLLLGSLSELMVQVIVSATNFEREAHERLDGSVIVI